MGYYTNYNVNFVNTGNASTTEEDIVKVLAVINPDYFKAFTEDGDDWTLDDLFCEPMKWYDCKEDFIKVSKEFPKTLFIIDGFGEEPGDIWRMIFFGGNVATSTVNIIFSNWKWNCDKPPVEAMEAYAKEYDKKCNKSVMDYMFPLNSFCW